MASREPHISVLMPVFNGERFVASAIESIQNQTFEGFEFIIVDDGSTDRTPGILQSRAADDSRIRVLHQENAGVVGALNRGLRAARAPLVARMDADDLSCPTRFEEQYRFLAGAADYSVVGSAVRLIDEQGRGERVIHHPRRLADLREAVGAGRILAHPTAMIRRALLVKAGGYRRSFQGVEDTDLWLRLADLGPIGNLDQVLLDYRMHPGKVTEKSARWTRIKESVTRGIAFDRLEGLPEPDPDSSPFIDLALHYAERAVTTSPSRRNPWMDDRRTRRILRDIFQIEPSQESECRRLLFRLAVRQFRRLRWVEAAKTFFYRYRLG